MARATSQSCAVLISAVAAVHHRFQNHLRRTTVNHQSADAPRLRPSPGLMPPLLEFASLHRSKVSPDSPHLPCPVPQSYHHGLAPPSQSSASALFFLCRHLTVHIRSPCRLDYSPAPPCPVLCVGLSAGIHQESRSRHAFAPSCSLSLLCRNERRVEAVLDLGLHGFEEEMNNLYLKSQQRKKALGRERERPGQQSQLYQLGLQAQLPKPRSCWAY